MYAPMKIKATLLLLFVTLYSFSQTLTISNTGQTGVSGTNWSTSGTNPLTIRATGTADINTSVITGYLDSGISVLLETTASVSRVSIASPISKTSGSDASLTVKSGGRIVLGNTLTATVGALDVVLWSDFDNDNNDGGVSVMGAISSNGGDVWLGGSNTSGGSYTWNGLTVGNGPSVGSDGFNWNGLDIYASITTNNGDFLAWAGNGYSNGIDGIGSDGANDLVNTGSGDITLITDKIDGSGAQSIKFKTTGVFSLVPNAGSFTSTFNWNPTISGGNIDFGADFEYLGILNFPNLTGLNIGQYSGMQNGSGNPVVLTNTSSIEINSNIAIAGAVNVYGDNIYSTSSISASNNGHILLKGSGYVVMAENVDLSTNGGDIILWSNTVNEVSAANENNEIDLRGNNTITTNGGKITIAGGLDNGSNGGTANDGIPDGYAYSGFNGTNFAADFGANVTLDTSTSAGGGDVVIRGSGFSYGVRSTGSFKIDSGTGSISISGKSTINNGIDLNGDAIVITTSNTTGNAINIKGETTASGKYGVILGSGGTSAGNTLIQATGANGAVTITGTSANSVGLYGRENGTLQVLAQSGNINLRAENLAGATNAATADFKNVGGLFYLGNRKDATAINGVMPAITTSSSAIKLQADYLSWGAAEPVLNTTGTFNVESVSDSFSTIQNLETDWFTFTNISGLTIGKSTNVQNVIINEDLTVAGPVTAYGKDITVNSDIAVTTTNDYVLLSASNAILLSAGSITTQDGSVLLNSDSDTSNAGNIVLSLFNIETNGGDITLGGGSAGIGYAVGSETSISGYGRYRGILLNKTVLDADGGNISIKGKGWQGSPITAVDWPIGIDVVSYFEGSTAGTEIKTKGIGTILMEGTGGILNNNGSHNSGVNFYLEASNVTANKKHKVLTETGAITINGASGTGSTTSKKGISFDYGTTHISSTTGNISLNGTTPVNSQGLSVNTTAIATIGSDESSAVTSGNILIAADNLGLVGALNINSSGTLKVVSVNDGFSNDITIPSSKLNLANTVSGLTIGKTTNTANVTINSVSNIAGPISIYGGDITLNSNVSSSLVNSSILLKATGNIIQGTDTSLTTDGGDIIYWTDSDVNNAGYIDLSSNGQRLTTNGGNITMAGGAGTTNPTGVANGGGSFDGINLGETSGSNPKYIKFDTRKTGEIAGGVLLSGKTSGAYDGFYTNNLQIFANDLSIKGETSTATNYGIRLGSGSIYDGTGGGTVIDVANDLSLTAINTASSYSGKTIRTGANPRVYADGNILINSSGKLDYTSSSQAFLNINPGKNLTLNIDGTANFTTPFGDPGNSVSQGDLIVQSYLEDSFTSAFDTTNWEFSANLNSLTIGKPTNIANITINNTSTIAGPITVYGGDVALNKAITATNNTISVKATDAVTQAEALTADKLVLSGSGTFTLDNTSNNITTLAGGTASSKLGFLNYVNSAALTIGDNNNVGIVSTGKIVVETLNGNLTLTQNIATDDTSDNAIVLNAGKSDAIGTATAGDIIVSGAPTISTGSNGIAKLFSGSETNSTGLTTLAGGPDHVRTGFDETSVVIPGLDTSDTYAIYRKIDVAAALVSGLNKNGKIITTGADFVDKNGALVTNSRLSINGESIAIPFLNVDASNSNSYSGSGTTWTDLTGNGHNGTLVNGPTYNYSDNSGSIVTDGSNDYVLFGPLPYVGFSTSNLTWELWVNPSDSNGNIMSMSSVYPQSGWNMPPIAASDSKFIAEIWDNNKLTAQNTYSQGTWYHVVLTLDHNNNTQSLYVNGVLNDSQSGINYSSSNQNNYISLGDDNPGIDNTGMFGGKYGEFRIYNKSLSSSQVLNNYNLTKGRYGL